MFKVPEEYRVTSGPSSTTEADGNNGVFEIHFHNVRLEVTACDEGGWESVSVSHCFRYPRWEELNFIKNLFWEAGTLVVHYFDEKAVNTDSFARQMWHKTGADESFPRPPIIYTGVPNGNQSDRVYQKSDRKRM